MIHIFRSVSGELSAADDVASSLYLIHSAYTPQKEAECFQNIQWWGEIILFAGLGLGYHINTLANTIPTSASIILIDYYEFCIDFVCKNIFPHQKTVRISSSNGIITSDWEKDCLHLFPSMKMLQIVRHPTAYALHRVWYDQIIDTIVKIRDSCSACSISPKKTGRILVLYGAYFLENELLNAIKKSNTYSSCIVDYRIIEQSLLDFEQRLIGTIEREQPSVIFSINMKGFDAEGVLSSIVHRYGIKVLIWFVDDPHPIVITLGRWIHAGMCAFCWEQWYIPFLQKLPFSSVKYLPLATDPDLFHPSTHMSIQYKLGFVGSALTGPFLHGIEKKVLIPRPYYPMLVQSCAEKLLDSKEDVVHILRYYCKDNSVPLSFDDRRNITWICSLIIHTASMIKRKVVLRSLVPMGLELFGDPKEWEALFGVQISTHKNVDYTTELCSVYQSILININITSSQMRTAVNQRVFDVPASGSFLLTDKQKDIESLFEPNREFISYTSLDHLKELIGYYGTHDTERNEVIQAARKRILAHHTYTQRLCTALQDC